MHKAAWCRLKALEAWFLHDEAGIAQIIKRIWLELLQKGLRKENMKRVEKSTINNKKKEMKDEKEYW